MPRRNNRETYAPLDLTKPPSEVQAKATIKHGRPFVSRDVTKARHQEQARMRGGIDWNICLVPGCGRDSYVKPLYSGDDSVPEYRRDYQTSIALCFEHAIVAFEAVAKRSDEPAVIEAMATLHEVRNEREKQRIAEAKAHWLRRDGGDIYFVRLGELIKVGWTSDLWSRLKQYGASAILLAHYPGTRQDETNLHRNLRPALAKGREWYQDGPILQRFIDEAIEKHGPPAQFEDLWTVPKTKPQVRRR